MGVAVYVSLERPIDGLDASSVDGKGLGRVLDHVEEMSSKSGHPSLMSFFSASSDQVPEGLEPEELPPEQWFPAAEGLAVVKALLAQVGQGDSKLDGARRDLESIQRVLEEAKGKRVRFHLSMDI